MDWGVSFNLCILRVHHLVIFKRDLICTQPSTDVIVKFFLNEVSLVFAMKFRHIIISVSYRSVIYRNGKYLRSNFRFLSCKYSTTPENRYAASIDIQDKGVGGGGMTQYPKHPSLLKGNVLRTPPPSTPFPIQM